MYKITSAILALAILCGAGTMAQAKTDHHNKASSDQGGFVCRWNADYNRVICTLQ